VNEPIIRLEEQAAIAKIQARTSEDFTRQPAKDQYETMRVIEEVIGETAWSERYTSDVIGWPNSTLSNRRKRFRRSKAGTFASAGRMGARNNAEDKRARAVRRGAEDGLTTAEVMDAVNRVHALVKWPAIGRATMVFIDAPRQIEEMVELLEGETQKPDEQQKAGLIETASHLRELATRLEALTK